MKRLVSYGQVIKMIHDSVVQNDNTNITNNYFTWWHIVKQQTIDDPYGFVSGNLQEENQEENKEENEKNFYTTFLGSGNTDYSLLDEEQQKKFRDAEKKVRLENPEIPKNDAYRKLVVEAVNTGATPQAQSKPNLTSRVLSAGGKLSQGVKNVLSRTGQAMQRDTDIQTARKVKEIDSKTANVKSAGAKQINDVLSSNVFGRTLNQQGRGDALLSISQQLKNNPKFMQEYSGGKSRFSTDSLPYDAKTKNKIASAFGSTITPATKLALETLNDKIKLAGITNKDFLEPRRRKGKRKKGQTTSTSSGRKVGREKKPSIEIRI